VPTITIDGKDYLVDEGVTPEQVKAHIGGAGYIAGDVAKSIVPGIASGMANVGRLVGRLWDAASGASDIPIQEPGFQSTPGATNLTEAAAQRLTQGNYQPQTTGGRYAQAAGEGIGGTLASGGVSAAPLALGAAGGLTGEAGARITGSPWGRFLGGLIPGAGFGGFKALVNPGGKVYSNAREALSRTDEQLANARNAAAPPAAVQSAAQQLKVPIAGWQAYPQGTAIQKLGTQAATTEGSAPLQAIIRNQQGPTQDLQAALQRATQQGWTPKPAATQLLANLEGSGRLQDLDLLRHGTPGQHEMGQAAALAELAGPHVPLLRTLIPGGAFAAQRGWKEFLFGQPTQQAEQAIYGAPTIEAMKAAAQTNPRAAALTQMLRAYTVPAGQGQTTPFEGPQP
jgi:hypothetical protein